MPQRRPAPAGGALINRLSEAALSCSCGRWAVNSFSHRLCASFLLLQHDGVCSRWLRPGPNSKERAAIYFQLGASQHPVDGS